MLVKNLGLEVFYDITCLLSSRSRGRIVIGQNTEVSNELCWGGSPSPSPPPPQKKMRPQVFPREKCQTSGRILIEIVFPFTQHRIRSFFAVGDVLAKSSHTAIIDSCLEERRSCDAWPKLIFSPPFQLCAWFWQKEVAAMALHDDKTFLKGLYTHDWKQQSRADQRQNQVSIPRVSASVVQPTDAVAHKQLFVCFFFVVPPSLCCTSLAFQLKLCTKELDTESQKWRI